MTCKYLHPNDFDAPSVTHNGLCSPASKEIVDKSRTLHDADVDDAPRRMPARKHLLPKKPRETHSGNVCCALKLVPETKDKPLVTGIRRA